MTQFKTFIIIILFLLPFFSIFAQTENVGIIPSNIWYSKDPFFENDKIKIYTVVFNSDKRELSGTVIFFDKNVFLGRKDFKVASNKAIDVSIDWAVTAGEHVIFAKIENAKFLISKDKYEEIYIAENKTIESKKTVSKKINLENTNSNLVNSFAQSDTFSGIQKVVTENTPPFVTKAIDTTVTALENTRKSGITLSSENKILVQKRIEELKIASHEPEINAPIEEKTGYITKEKLSIAKDTNTTNILKPFNYIKLFMFTIFIVVFKSKVLFYGIIIVVLFTILRFIWRLIF